MDLNLPLEVCRAAPCEDLSYGGIFEDRQDTEEELPTGTQPGQQHEIQLYHT